MFISNLKDDKTIPILANTVLKDQQGKKRTGNINTLQYLFEFLDAYDFGAEGGEEIQEDNKTLINASVLGLIFEKINGYKDGSFFTPGFITMYMCRETIRKAVVQKFNEAKTPLLRGAGGVSQRREIIPYNPKLKELARDLRNNSTKSEIILWNELKGKFETKYDFHRQKPIDNYIADFFCYELKLVIEIDGVTHGWEESQKKDFDKEWRLNELGLNVLRFQDSDIIDNLEAVLDIIKLYVTGFEKGELSKMEFGGLVLNPLTGNRLIDNTPLNPLSRGDFKAATPLSRGDFSESQAISRRDFESLDDIYEQIGDDRMFTRQQANDIVNSIKICDPAVGSGHFLVSALNEMIAVKNDLKILQDRNGKRLKEYQVEVVNDELIVTHEDGELFEYTPPSPLKRGDRGVSESQRVQETLFHEKQTIIENCLFGVDINSNSVKICRLRLWIELLKNAYYKNATELETLPNIDINIKCGNSLVSRFAIDADLKQALKKKKWNIDSYRTAVATYRNAENKEQKREMVRLIEEIKSDFQTIIFSTDPKLARKSHLEGELANLLTQSSVFGMSDSEKKSHTKKVESISKEIEKITNELEAIKNNVIYDNAFEWRFEFPEVLNDDGDFLGFDVVIGNPPYVDLKELDNNLVKFIFAHYPTSSNRVNLYSTFVEKAFFLLKSEGYFSFIIPNSILMGSSYQNLRNLLKKEIYGIVKLPEKVFEDAAVETVIIEFKKKGEFEICQTLAYKKDDKVTELDETLKYLVPKKSWEIHDEPKFNIYISDEILKPLTKIHGKGKRLEEIADFTLGITPYDKYKGHSKELIEKKEFHSDVKLSDEYKPLIKGENIVPYLVNEKENSYIKYGPWLGAPREERFFTEPRVIVRQIVSGKPPKIYAGYTDKPLYFTQIGFSIIPKSNITVFELTALLNSKLINFYHRYLFLDIEKELFQKILIENCKLFPCRAFKDRNSVKEIIEKIIKTKSSDADADTTEFETNLDKMIYELYELTEDEIRIVEGR